MKLRKFYAALAAVLMGGCMLTACSEDDEPSVNQETTETELIVSGVWKSGEVVHLDRHLVIPEGQSLTIEPGVTVIVDEKGVGVNHVPVEIEVKGNLYVLGTAEKPVTFTVDPALRTADNTFKGLWGGIVAYESCEEMALDHVVIEYTGAQVIEGSPSAISGIYTAGDDMYPQVTTSNLNGR